MFKNRNCGLRMLTANPDVLGPNVAVATNKTTQLNDTIFANADGALSSADVIDGAGGVDTIFSVQNVFAGTAADGDQNETLKPVLTDVEKVFIDVNADGGAFQNTFTFDGGSSTGLKQIWSDNFTGSANNDEDTFAVTNVSTATTVGIKKGDGEYNVTANFTGVTGTSDSANLALSAANVDTVTMAGVETVNVSNADGNSTVATLTAAQMTALNISGSKNVTITNTVDFANNASATAIDGTVNASGLAGKLTANFDSGDLVDVTVGDGGSAVALGAGNDKFVSGSGIDMVTTGAGIDNVSTGGGNDTITVGANLTKEDKIDGGAGDDTLVTNATTIDATVKAAAAGVSNVEVYGTNAAGAVTIDFAGLATYNQVAVVAAGAAVDANNVENDDKLVISAARAGGTTVDAVNIAPKVDGGANVATIKLVGDADLTGGSAANIGDGIDAALIETLNLEVVGTKTTGAADTVTISAAGTGNSVEVEDNGKIVLTSGLEGAATVQNNIDLGTVVGTNATVDASAFLGNVTATAASGNVTLKGGAGVDTFTGGAGIDNISGAAGKDVLMGMAGNDIIDGGAGEDVITGGAGADVMTGGSEADTFVFATGSTGGTPTKDLFDTITDFAKASDIIKFDTNLTVEISAAASAGTAKVNAEGIATFNAADDTLAEKIAAVANTTNSDGDFVIFEDAGDSYVYIADGADGAASAGDVLVKLTGVTGLSDSTITTDSLTIA